MVYLDNNATTRPTEAVVAAVGAALTEFWHNPSSVHRAGQAARAQVELARRDIADLIGARPRDIVFTSGGTEAIDLAVRGTLGARPGKSVLVTTAVEHAAVRDLAEDLEKRGEVEVRLAPIDGEGIVDVGGLAALLDGAALVSVQWVNNETGAIQPVAEIGRLCRERGVLFHCDATQRIGKLPADVATDGLFDLLTFAPHKFHGPKGVGVLWRRAGVGGRPTLLGAQELGRRGGTENVPGIAGAGAAAREAASWLADAGARTALAMLRDRFESGVLAAAPGSRVNGPRDAPGTPADRARRIWNTTNIGFPRLEAEALLLLLSERGVCASAGAACSSGSLDPSPVLLAMGVPREVAHGSLRFSLSRETTAEEIDRAVAAVAGAARALGGTMAGLGPA